MSAIVDPAGIDLIDEAGLDLSAPVTVPVQGVPAEAALRQLLRGYDLMFYFAGDGGSGSFLRKVWIHRPGYGGMAPERPQQTQGDPQQRFASSDPAERAAALMEIYSLPEAAAETLILQGLRDPDESVRQQAILLSQTGAFPVPLKALEDLFRWDPSGTVRLAALDAIVSASGLEPGVIANLLDSARFDRSEEVRRRVSELQQTLSGGGEPVPGMDAVEPAPSEMPENPDPGLSPQ